MQELILNGPTIVILIAIAALAALSVRRMTRRGLCDCGDRNSRKSVPAATAMARTVKGLKATSPVAKPTN